MQSLSDFGTECCVEIGTSTPIMNVAIGGDIIPALPLVVKKHRGVGINIGLNNDHSQFIFNILADGERAKKQ